MVADLVPMGVVSAILMMAVTVALLVWISLRWPYRAPRWPA